MQRAGGEASSSSANAKVPSAADASSTVASGSSTNAANKSIKNAIIVRRNQKNNPILKMFQNVPWQYEDILADYEVGRTTGVLFLRCGYY